MLNELKAHKDLDGVGCAVVAKYCGISSQNISYFDNDEIDNEILKNIDDICANTSLYSEIGIIFITDLNIKKETAEKVNAYMKYIKTIEFNLPKFILLDHHSHALFLNEYDWATVKIDGFFEKTCGTELFYEYCANANMLIWNFPDTIKLYDFVTKVKRYDTWTWKEKYKDLVSSKMNDLLQIFGIDDFVKDMISKISFNTPFINESDKILLSISNKQKQNYIEQKNKEIFIKDILGYKAGIVFAEQYISELGSALLERNLNLDIIIMLNGDHVSYRTIRDDVDLAEIALKFNGGGHPKSAGHTIKVSAIDSYINKIFEIK